MAKFAQTDKEKYLELERVLEYWSLLGERIAKAKVIVSQDSNKWTQKEHPLSLIGKLVTKLRKIQENILGKEGDEESGILHEFDITASSMLSGAEELTTFFLLSQNLSLTPDNEEEEPGASGHTSSWKEKLPTKWKYVIEKRDFM